MSRARKKPTKGRGTHADLSVSVVPAASRRLFSGWLPWIETHAALLGVLLTLVGSLRIASTYTVFNHTGDEPAHIGCGMEWFDKSTYKLEPQHPPLARVMAALGPYLVGRRSQNRDVSYKEGVGVLYEANHYDRNLALARVGILPFFWLACLVVFEWARRHFGKATAVFSLLLFTMVPPVLAHAGLATTDMALAALLGATFLVLLIWAEAQGWTNTVVLGVCGGLLVLSKFSSFLFFPAIAGGALLWYWMVARPSAAAIAKRALPLILSLFIAFMVVWAGYRFSFGKEPLLGLSLPFPELFAGLHQLMAHNAAGHPSFLLGQRSMFGFWYYYPVVLAVKTPIPFLALAIFGAMLCLKRRREIRWVQPLVFVAAILITSLFSRINIGVRHVLPVYIALSILAAIGMMELLERANRARWAGWLAAVAGAWMIATSALSHPDYLPYTNFLAGDEPEQVVADSDLDWGQDMKRLGLRLRELGAPSVYFDPFIIADLEKWHGFPPIRRDGPDIPAPGYHAVSLTVLKVMRMRMFDSHPEIQPWPERFKPMERVGKGVLLYYFPGPQ